MPASAPPTLDLNGITTLPNDKIAMVVTYLAMDAPPRREHPRAPENLQTPDAVRLRHCEQIDLQTYRTLFRAIGEPWLWFGRLAMSDAALSARLRSPRTWLALVEDRTTPIGMIELDFSDPASVELAYFGLIPGHTGKGIGHWMMQNASEQAWSRAETRRLWVHTCTLDHPAALGFYQAHGFRPYARAIEVADDPRLTGLMDRDKAPQVPLIA